MQLQTDPNSVGPSVGTSRRRDVRVAAPPGLRATLLSQGLDVAVQDISVGGLAIRTAVPLPAGSEHAISLRLGGQTVRCRVRTAHCRRVGRTWVIGLAFVGDESSGRAAICRLMDTILGTAIAFC